MFSKNLRRTLFAAALLSALSLSTPVAQAWPLSGSPSARFQKWDVLSSLWSFFTGMLKDNVDTGMTIDPNGNPDGTGMTIDPNGVKAGGSLDPHGTPVPPPAGSNSAGEGDPGGSLDPHG